MFKPSPKTIVLINLIFLASACELIVPQILLRPTHPRR